MTVSLLSRRINERTFARPAQPARLEVLGERVAVRLFASRSGALARPVLALHGLGSDGTDLVAVAHDLLRGEGALAGPVALVDLPGFGGSDRPERDYSVARAAAAALVVQDLLRWPAALWLGCSYGGHVALRAALDAPRRVAGLALISSGGLDPAPNQALGAYFAEERLRARSRDEVAAAIDLLIAQPNGATQDYRARRLALHDAPLVPGGSDVRAVARSAAGALADDAGARLEQVAAPVALLHGGRDPLVPVDLARQAAQRLPHADLTVLPEAGHLPWLEDPTAVAAAVSRLARRLVPTPAQLAAARGPEV